jgi:hypothetical protein
VQDRAARKGKTVQAYLLPLIRAWAPDWPWDKEMWAEEAELR